MKKLLIFILLVFFSTLSHAQNTNERTNSNCMIGIASNIGINRVIRFQNDFRDEATYHGKTAFSYGINYFRSISPNIRLNLGVYYSSYRISFGYPISLFPEGPSFLETLNIISVPILFNAYSNKNYFLSFGPLIDFTLPRKSRWTDAQNGIGFSLGVGKEFLIKNFSLDISPNVEIHSILPFSLVHYQQRLLVFGLKLGLNFNLE